MVCVISNYICDKTKKNVVFGNRPDENFFITHAPTHPPARMCIRIQKLNLKKQTNKQKKTKKKQEHKKTKEAKKEKIVSPEN